MARPSWIVDLDEDFPSSARVAAAVSRAHVVAWKDVLVGRWPDVASPVVGYGTMRTMTRLARVPHLRSAVVDDYGKLRCTSYYRYIFDLLGRAAVFVPFNALPHLPLARMFGPSVFVRSDTNYKLFPASVVPVEACSRWLETYQEHGDELIVVSEVASFDVEYRCFCRDGRFFCGSSYPREPYLDVPDRVRRFAEEAARRVLPMGLSMVTVDVGATGELLRVVEIGGVNSWGLYGANVEDFVRELEADCLERAAAEDDA